jgi:Asp/Glu/hydantoin racemase
MSALVSVINPNSLVSVTTGIARALRPIANSLHCRFEYSTLDAGPPGIATQRDADRAAPFVADFVATHASHSDGFVIACYSDPGLFAARELTNKPVIGIGHASLDRAATLGNRIGVIAASSVGIARHWRYYRMLGVASQIVGERAIDLPVEHTGDPALALDRLTVTATQLRDDGADVIVLGCAGMADLRDALEDAVCLPVVEPCRAAAEAIAAELAARSAA